MAKLITPTLLNSFDWLKNAPSGYWHNKAVEDFSNMLNRIYGEASPMMSIGNDIEAAASRFANYQLRAKTGDPKEVERVKEKFTNLSPQFKRLVDLVSGAAYQQKAKRIVRVDEEEYLIYGKIDFLFSDMIIDTKVTGEYKGQDRYLSGHQHEMYCFCKDIPNFKYIVVEVPDPETKKIRDIFEVPWSTTDTYLLRDPIIEQIREVIEYIKKDEALSKAYYNKFNLYG